MIALLFAIALVQEPSTADDSQKSLRLVRQLGADSYQDRQAANRELLKLGDSAYSALIKNRNHRNPEVRFRVANLLKRLYGNVAYFSPQQGRKFKSVESKNRVSLTVINKSRRPISVTWIGFDGKRSRNRNQQQSIKSGESYRWKYTYETHKFLITDQNQNELVVFAIGSGKQSRFVVRDEFIFK